jgi:hypothetical protein
MKYKFKKKIFYQRQIAILFALSISFLLSNSVLHSETGDFSEKLIIIVITTGALFSMAFFIPIKIDDFQRSLEIKQNELIIYQETHKIHIPLNNFSQELTNSVDVSIVTFKKKGLLSVSKY